MSRYLFVALCIAAACGGRTSRNGLDGGGDAPSATGGQLPPQGGGFNPGGASSRGGGVSSQGGESSSQGGRTGGGDAGGGRAGTSTMPPAGAGGAPTTTDDATTIGDERPGYVQCWARYSEDAQNQPVKICQTPQVCCAGSGDCARASDCEGPANSCDGDEDCPSGKHCCRGSSFTCQTKCLQGAASHLACKGACADFDRDGIPDGGDACPTGQVEDGKAPLSEDGCRDTDGDSIRDGLDRCDGKPEDGKPPNPTDGCPAN